MRGKLLVPELKVRFVDESKNQELKEKVVQVLTVFADISSNVCPDHAIDVYADLLSFIFKAPMLLSYAPSSGNYLSTAYEYFFTYVIARHCNVINYTNVEDLMKKLEDLRKKLNLTQISGYINSIKEIYEALLYTPADTRPGYNVSSLASHLQLTSILVWLLQASSLDLNYLRIAALLHDLGKLFEPEHHVKAGVEILDKVLANIGKDNKIYDPLTRVRDIVLQHHSDYDSILSKADELASSADRLSKIIGKALEGSEDEKCYKLRREESFECFNQLGKEKYEELSVTLFKYLLGTLIDKKSELKVFQSDKKVNVAKVVPNDLIGYLVYIDFPSIQKFISSFPNLRDMSFASMLVDFMTTVSSFVYIDNLFYNITNGKSRIPAEALLSGYGGHSYIVVRKDIGSDLENKLASLRDLGKDEFGVKLSVRIAEFAYRNYVRNFAEVTPYLYSSTERYVVNSEEEEVYSLGFHVVCDNCGIRPAVEIVSINNENMKLCSLCYKVNSLSINRGFSAKVNSTYIVGNYTINPESFRKDIDPMEFIAGYRDPNDSTYLSLIKADGNYGGEIFRNSITFSDYIDRSFRLDYGIKTSFYETLKELLDLGSLSEQDKENIASRILSGVLYLGGDDVLIFSPAIISLPFAVKMFQRAEEYTGFTFKVGVLTIKPDHPIQFAIRAVDQLMEDAKIEGSPKTSISCLTFESSLATDGVVRRIEDGNSYLLLKNELKDVEGVLNMLGYMDFKNVLSYYYDKKQGKKKTREKLGYINYIVEYSFENDFLSTLAYMLRYKFRAESKEEKDLISFILRKYVEIKEKEGKEILPIQDYFYMLKTFRLGVGL
ncbi:HD domain-containing protein [Acidianus manzaensis]|uniref:HD domain-containing protein n=1 Tax=Acidianus manzaensis TaxID=282676 RepID=A0A1W6JWF7_9CREN|nr:HD domain-containing protein [Acidianus manzaensis]ARM74572.1 hypothetical protein B6F84_00025 [Acidianus manzaensis]